jgi:hypothetical protein
MISKFDKINFVNKREFKDNKQFQFRANSFAKIGSEDNYELVSLNDIYEINQEKDKNFFYNKMNTLFEYLEEDYDLFFFTLTFDPRVHKTFNSLNSMDRRVKALKQMKSYYNNFYRTLLKNRLFRNELTTDKRFYVRASELHKSKVLHEHTSFFINNDSFQEFFSLLYTTYLKFNRLGRFELVLSNKFKELVKNEMIEVEVEKGKIVYIFENDLDLVKSGNFFYVKFLENEDSNKSLLKYVMKYALKSAFNNEDTLDSKFDRAFFLEAKVRRISFSNFLFPKYLFQGKFESLEGNYVNEDYSLKELTDLKNLGNIKVYYKVFEKEDFNDPFIPFLIEENLQLVLNGQFEESDTLEEFISIVEENEKEPIKEISYISVNGVYYYNRKTKTDIIYNYMRDLSLIADFDFSDF